MKMNIVLILNYDITILIKLILSAIIISVNYKKNDEGLKN